MTTAAGVLVLDDATFDATIGAADGPVLVEFGATWCGPCRQMAPVLADYAAETAGKVTVATVDVDTAPDVARRYGVMSVPALVLVVDGDEVARLVGGRPLSRLRDELAPHLR